MFPNVSKWETMIGKIEVQQQVSRDGHIGKHFDLIGITMSPQQCFLV